MNDIFVPKNGFRLEIGLDKEYLKYKDGLIQFFMSIKGNVKVEDLTTSTPLIHYIVKNRSYICDQAANIN